VKDARPIIIAASFSPEGSGTNEHLGAANKIRAVVRILARSGRRIILVDSSHNREAFRWTRVDRADLGASHKVALITINTFPFRPIGKLLNLLSVGLTARRLARENPALVWVYNGYAFDARLGMKLASKTGCALVLELEDWPTARRRGFHPKPFIDLFFFSRLLERVELVTCVNSTVESRAAKAGADTMLLPGTLAPALAAGNVPSPFSGREFTLGYFGALSAEKGVDILLALAQKLPAGWKVVVTGSGPLQEKFVAAASRFPRFSYHGPMPQDRLVGLMQSCDAIVNPHKPITEMNDGVFPFKVFEAIASGRLLISTEVPDCGIPLNGVLWFDGTESGLRAALESAPSWYNANKSGVSGTAEKIRANYSDATLYSRLSERLPLLANSSRANVP
jgi:glycosyltransferase involved in cell wall biosynthesis